MVGANSLGDANMKLYLLSRLKEASTWRGLVAMLFSVIYFVDPTASVAIAAWLLGVIEAVREELKSEDKSNGN